MAMVARGIVALQPDVVALQEVREVSGQLENQAGALAHAIGFHHVFAPAVEFGGGHEGLAILSRFHLAEPMATELPHAEATERRVLLSARVETGGLGVWVHTTHLNYRLQHGQQREDQVMAIDAVINDPARSALAPQILMGDFNARPDADEMRWMRGLTTLGGKRTVYQDAWERLHPDQPGWTWAAANRYTQRLRFLQPDRRLDYIYVTPERRDGRGIIEECRIVMDQPSPDGHFASDHYGVYAEIRVESDGPGEGQVPGGGHADVR